MNELTECYFDATRGVWLVCGIDEAKYVLSRPDLFGSGLYSSIRVDVSGAAEVLMATGQRHARLRGAFVRGFGARIGEFTESALEPAARLFCQGDAGRRLDSVSAYFRKAVFDMLGLQQDEGNELIALVRSARSFFDTAGQRSNAGDLSSTHY